MDLTIVTVKVGPEAKLIAVYKGLSLHHSRYFEASLTGEFREAVAKEVDLADVEELDFLSFVHWLHTQAIEVDPAEEVHTNRYAERLVNLYVIGDRLECERFRNDVIDTFNACLEVRDELPDTAIFQYTLDRLLESSKIYRSLIDHFSYYWNVYEAFETDAESVTSIPALALAEMWAMTSKLPQDMEDRTYMTQAPWLDDPCRYHDHTNGSVCLKKGS